MGLILSINHDADIFALIEIGGLETKNKEAFLRGTYNYEKDK